MRKIKTIDDALELFKVAANDNMSYAGKGDYKKANKAQKDIVKIREYLILNDALGLLRQFYNDENLWVRLIAACSLAPIDGAKAKIIIEEIKEMNIDPYSFSANGAILNWADLSQPTRYDELFQSHNKGKK